MVTWMEHVAKTRAMTAHKGKSFKEVLKAASLTWVKGGASKSVPGKKDGSTKATSKDDDVDGHRKKPSSGKPFSRGPKK